MQDRHRNLVALATLIIAAAAPLSAQPQSAGTRAPAARVAASCTADPTPAPLGFVVDSTTIAELERRRGSNYVQAFLIGLFASQSRNSQHPLVACARSFVNANLGSFSTLRSSLLSSDQLIAALREEELRLREATRRLSGSGRTLGSVVSDARGVLTRLQAVLAEPTTPVSTIRLTATPLRSAAEVLRSEVQPRCLRGPLCPPLDSAQEALAALVRSGNELGGAALRVERLRQEQALLRASRARDSLLAPSPEDAKKRMLSSSAVLQDREKALVRELSTLNESWSRTIVLTGRALDAVTELERIVDSDSRNATSPLQAVTAAQAPQRSQPASIALPRSEAVVPTREARSPDLTVALVDFVVDRAKQEVIYAFIANLGATLDTSPLLRRAFPTTQQLIVRSTNGAVPQARDVAQVGLPVWRTALVSDLQRLPLHLLNNADSICARLETTRGSACRSRAQPLQLAARIGEDILGGSVILRSLESWEVTQGSSLGGLPPQLLPALSVSSQLIALSRTQGYVLPSESATSPLLYSSQSLLHASEETRRAFARLLLVGAAASLPDRQVDERAFTAGLLALAERTERLSLPASMAQDGGRTASAAYLVREALLVVSDAADLGVTLALSKTDAERLRRTSEDLHLLATAVDAFLSAAYSDAIVRTLQLVDGVRAAPAPGGLMKMTALAAALADARSEQQVVAAFETAASPIGGWRGKAVGDVPVSVSAYPGIAGGYESVVGEDIGSGRRSSASIGASLPIGFEFVLAPRITDARRRPLVRSVGLTLAPIDLGAVLSYRFDTGDPVTNEPQESLRQVFAPGIFLATGISSRWPLTMLTGWQFLPSARSVATSSGVERRSATRWTISFAVDVVLLELR
jgi:hypothetical protein